jgi:uncharacterized membrane protein
VSTPVLAAIDSTGYKVMLLVHILAVVIAFAPAWLTPILFRISGPTDKNAADALGLAVLRLSLPFVAIAGIVGFGLAGMSKPVGGSEALYKMSQAWLSIAIILWLVQLAVLFFVARPAFKALAAGDASARGRVMASTGITHLILVVMLYLMIFKPGL